MRLLSRTGDGNLIAVEFAEISIEKFNDELTENKCRLFLGGYSYLNFYHVISSEIRSNGTYALTKSEAEAIIKAVTTLKCVDLNEMGNYKIIPGTRYQTVYIRNDVDEFTDEDVPLLVEFSNN